MFAPKLLLPFHSHESNNLPSSQTVRQEGLQGCSGRMAARGMVCFVMFHIFEPVAFPILGSSLSFCHVRKYS